MPTATRKELKSSIAHCSLLEWRRWRRRRLLARQLDSALGCERLEQQSLGLEVGLLAGSGELSDVELRTHGHRGDAALALEVVDDGGVTRNRDGELPAAVAAAGDDGVDVAGLDAVRRKTVLRRDETEPARARPCVGKSPAALSGASTASLSTALAAAELLGSQRVQERCELCVVKRLARVPEEAVDLGVRRENVLAALTTAHAAQHVGLAALLVQVEQARIVKRRPRPLRARTASARASRPEFDLGLQSWSSSA